MQNSYNLSSTICTPGLFGDVWLENKDEFLGISISFDFVLGTVSSLFTYKIYQGVEISHPVYAVVFSNNLLANILSLLMFLQVIIRYCTECCSCRYLGMALFSCVFFMNCICWTIVAILRYHLLVTMKRQGTGGTDMMKITRIALGFYWGLLILLSVARCTLIEISDEVGNFSVRWIGTLLIISVLTIITMVVYYRLDVELEANQKVTNTKHETEIGGAAPTRVTPNEGQRNTSTSSCEMKIRSPYDGKNQSNKEEHIPTCTSRLHEMKVTAVEFENSIPSSITTRTTVGCHGSDEKPHGGIYVGEEEICKKHNTTNIMKDQEEMGSSVKIEDGKTTQKNEIKKYSSAFCSYYDISLPNEVNENKTNIANRTSFQGSCPKPNDKQEDIQTRVKKLTHKEQQNADDRIVVDPNWLEEEQHDPGEDKREIQHAPEEQASLEVNEYRNSREHESIRKAFIANWLCIGFYTALLSGSVIVHRSSGKNISPILIVRSIISLYRTCIPIVSSIYCFDVIRSLFRQILENAIDSVRNLLGMTRRFSE